MQQDVKTKFLSALTLNDLLSKWKAHKQINAPPTECRAYYVFQK